MTAPLKIAIASDLHLEFGGISIANTQQASILILSGDICKAEDVSVSNQLTPAGITALKFFKEVSNEFEHIIYIMGNHEHYSGNFSTSYATLKDMLARESITNIYLLEKETIEIKNWLFIGGSLWSNFNNENPLSMDNVQKRLNDYRVSSYTDTTVSPNIIRKLRTSDTLRDHKIMREFIKSTLDNRRNAGVSTNNVVIVGHHSPSMRSIHPRFAHERLLNGGFASNLEDIIEAYPEIALWTHGHTHDPYDYTVGKTRIVCNPRGYINYEPAASQWQLKYIDL